MDSENASTAGIEARFRVPTIEELSQRLSHLEILEFVGRGGMGAVYKARQPSLDRLVAVKILPREISATPGFTERFSREAKALAKLSHQNIISVFEFGQLEDQHYIIMEFVDGTDLRQLIDASEVTSNQALEIVRQICDALQYAHGQGVVHRDIKPENILIDKSGEVKIADFGLAKLVDTESMLGSLTGTQQIMGTLRYMAPEQTRATKEVDHRADIFSLGVIFYELLTGDLPIGRFRPPSKKTSLDARLDDVVLRALEHEPEDRYQQASDVNVDLAAIRAQNVAPVPPRKSASLLPDEQPPTLSAKAVWGAAWFMVSLMATAFLIFSLLSVQAVTSSDGHESDSQITLLGYVFAFVALIVLPLGLAGLIGSPILGFMSYNDIKKSQGKVYGLRLAVFDTLAVPLLFMNVILIVAAGSFLPQLPTRVLFVVSLFWALVIDLIIYWVALKQARRSLGLTRPFENRQASVKPQGIDRTKLMMLLICINIAVLIFAIVFAPNSEYDSYSYSNDFEYVYKTVINKHRNVPLISMGSIVLSSGIYIFLTSNKTSSSS